VSGVGGGWVKAVAVVVAAVAAVEAWEDASNQCSEKEKIIQITTRIDAVPEHDKQIRWLGISHRLSTFSKRIKGFRMATPDGISAEDWDEVHEFALEILDASVKADDNERTRRKVALLNYLDHLEGKYGELPSILATRADNIDDVEQRIQLLNRAYVLAKARNDSLNELEIAHSLTALYLEELQDKAEGSKWLECLRAHADQRGDSGRKEDYEHLSVVASKLPSVG